MNVKYLILKSIPNIHKNDSIIKSLSFDMFDLLAKDRPIITLIVRKYLLDFLEKTNQDERWIKYIDKDYIYDYVKEHNYDFEKIIKISSPKLELTKDPNLFKLLDDTLDNYIQYYEGTDKDFIYEYARNNNPLEIQRLIKNGNPKLELNKDARLFSLLGPFFLESIQYYEGTDKDFIYDYIKENSYGFEELLQKANPKLELKKDSKLFELMGSGLSDLIHLYEGTDKDFIYKYIREFGGYGFEEIIEKANPKLELTKDPKLFEVFDDSLYEYIQYYEGTDKDFIYDYVNRKKDNGYFIYPLFEKANPRLELKKDKKIFEILKDDFGKFIKYYECSDKELIYDYVRNHPHKWLDSFIESANPSLGLKYDIEFFKLFENNLQHYIQYYEGIDKQFIYDYIRNHKNDYSIADIITNANPKLGLSSDPKVFEAFEEKLNIYILDLYSGNDVEFIFKCIANDKSYTIRYTKELLLKCFKTNPKTVYELCLKDTTIDDNYITLFKKITEESPQELIDLIQADPSNYSLAFFYKKCLDEILKYHNKILLDKSIFDSLSEDRKKSLIQFMTSYYNDNALNNKVGDKFSSIVYKNFPYMTKYIGYKKIDDKYYQMLRTNRDELYRIMSDEQNKDIFRVNDFDFYSEAIAYDIKFLKFYEYEDIDVYNKALIIDDKYTLNHIGNLLKENKLYSLRYEDKFFKNLIVYDVELLKYYMGIDMEIVRIAYRNHPDKIKEMVKNHVILPDLFYSNKQIFMDLCFEDITLQEYYHGDALLLELYKTYPTFVMNYVCKSGLYKNRNIGNEDSLLIQLSEEKPDLIFMIQDNKAKIDQFINLANKGIIFDYETIEKNNILISDEGVINRLMEHDERFFNIYNGRYYENLKRPSFLPDNLSLNVISRYHGDQRDFIEKFDTLVRVLDEYGIGIDQFIQYELNAKLDYILQLNLISDIDKFINNKQIFNRIYNINANCSIQRRILSFMNFLKNYNRYPNIMLILNKEEVSDEQIKIIKYIFNLSYKIDGISAIVRLSDLIEQLNKSEGDKLNDAISSDKLHVVIDYIYGLLFNKTEIEVIDLLNKYGSSKDLRSIKYNTKDQTQINRVNMALLLVDMIEDVLNINDIDIAKSIANNISKNTAETKNIMYLFSSYEQLMIDIYSHELNEHLSKYDNLKSPEKVMDNDLSNKYGVPVIDYSNKGYLILGHVYSSSENLDLLVKGLTAGKGEDNTICLSAVSYRNQRYYYDSGELIFGYDEIPPSNFILSSQYNLSSNHTVLNGYNSIDFHNINYEQKRIIEVSEAPSSNSEILCFRENLKPKYLILPGGREPTKNELEIAKKYGLMFVKTQPVRQEIMNLERLEYKDDVKINYEDQIQKLNDIKAKLLNNNKKPRKIAILTDAHALFEPTLAVLTDARKNQCDEIYSLGDNIGLGPSPEKVVGLLEEFGVTSVMGNHELYTLGLIDELEEHLRNTGALEHAKKNSEWNRTQLSESNLEKIKIYPKTIDLVVGGKKLLLTHSIKDYNTGETNVNVDDYDEVFQGHIHFSSKQGKVTTLSGLAIGDNKNNRQASYIILTENPLGGFDIEERTVDYNPKDLKDEIVLSGLDSVDQQEYDKLVSWTGMGGR